MNHANKSFFSNVGAVLAIVIMLSVLVGCDAPNGGIADDYNVDTTPISCTIVFDEEFMETADVTPEEWLGYLEENSDGRPGYVGYDTYLGEITDDVVIVLEDGYGLEEWKELGVGNLQAVCSEFCSLGKECIIELHDNNTIADIWYNHDISIETAEEYAAQIKKWCAYLHLIDENESDMLEHVNYYSTSPAVEPAADENNYGISFEKIVCTYAAFDTEKGVPIIEYTIYSDGTVGVKKGQTDWVLKEAGSFNITEEQVQAITDTLRRYKVWTVGRCDSCDYGAYETILFYDSLGFEMDYCGGFEATSKRFNVAADIISDILADAHSTSTQPISDSDS